MATRRRVEPAPEPLETTGPVAGAVLPVIPEPEPEPPTPAAAALIGPPSAPMTPGWLMGIGARPETPAEHAARLGASAGKFNDIGYILGTAMPVRANWPAQPEEAVLVEAA